MIYLLYGEDTYRSGKKRQEIIDKFISIGGKDAITYLEVFGRSREELKEALESGSLFRDKRLVVLEGACEGDVNTVRFFEEKIPSLASSEDIFLFKEGVVPMSGEGMFLSLLHNAAKAQEFGNLNTAAFSAFTDKEIRDRAVVVSARDREALIRASQGNTWKLIQELEKTFLRQGQLTRHPGTYKVNIFALTDAIGSRKKREAFTLFHDLLREGVLPEKIFWTILWYVRSLLAVRDFIGAPQAHVARETGLHPFAAKKAVARTGKFTETELKNLYKSLSYLDIEVKQNRGDMFLGLERLILGI